MNGNNSGWICGNCKEKKTTKINLCKRQDGVAKAKECILIIHLVTPVDIWVVGMYMRIIGAQSNFE